MTRGEQMQKLISQSGGRVTKTHPMTTIPQSAVWSSHRDDSPQWAGFRMEISVSLTGPSVTISGTLDPKVVAVASEQAITHTAVVAAGVKIDALLREIWLEINKSLNA